MTNSAASTWRVAIGVLVLLVLGSLVAACTGDDQGGGRDDEADVRDDDGQVVDETEVDAYRIQVGDCFNGQLPTAVDSIDAVPCDQPHDQEAYAVFDLEIDGQAAGPDVPYPGDDQVQLVAQRDCIVQFTGYVGSAYETSILEVGLLLPTQETWEQIDDREVVCTVHRADGGQLEATAQGTAL
jgi:hypothetical protein